MSKMEYTQESKVSGLYLNERECMHNVHRDLRLRLADKMFSDLGKLGVESFFATRRATNAAVKDMDFLPSEQRDRVFQLRVTVTPMEELLPALTRLYALAASELEANWPKNKRTSAPEWAVRAQQLLSLLMPPVLDEIREKMRNGQVITEDERILFQLAAR